MTAWTPDDRRWVTRPPTDGSDVWSSERYSSTIDPIGRHGLYTYADYVGYAAPGLKPDVSYPYYAGTSDYAGTSTDPLGHTLPPYWPQPAGARQPVDGFATASLVFALFGGVPLAIPCALVALRRIARRPLRGRGLAIAGLAVSAAWLVVVAIVVMLAVVSGSSAATRNSQGVITHRGPLDVRDIRTGDCAELPTDLSKLTNGVAVRPCDQDHNAQVFETAVVTDSGYPGASQLEHEGLDACATALPSFLGATPRSMQIATLVPDERSWSDGLRTRVCLALSPPGTQITGDIRSPSTIAS